MAHPAEMAAIGVGSAGSATRAITAAAAIVVVIAAATAAAGVTAAEAATEDSICAPPAVDLPQTPLLRFIPE